MQGKVLSETNTSVPVYVGIDVCKDWLDVYLHPVGVQLRVLNEPVGLTRLKQELSGHDIALIVMEATAKYHRRAQRTLAAAGLAVAIVNPLRSRLFAEALGVLAKTDAIDARLLALLGENVKPPATPLLPVSLEELQELVQARAAATAERTALLNRCDASQTTFLKAELMRRTKAVEGHIDRLEAEIKHRVDAEPTLARRYQILRSIPGIGPVSAVALIVGLAELGTCSGKAAALLTGLAPIACDSGGHTGARHIKGGRAQVRIVLYMAAIAAIRCNPDLATFYKRLRAAGKKAKVALTAVMRKLVVLANTLIKENREWKPIAP
jgi:transposase